ncbi:mitosis initiation protein fs(1)Ya isoform X2 [Contarinia nasturtii]|uniref:mitosis initiation protein fs(1)Ya isoform X2 n=1 Tax=Contarinia nasturtii TaxID=265458 RepID=UPI0012D4A0F3|nr:mitosis initiation protein fs(1)Ya isoform X2 [Contarinia nasturtii]
MVSIPEEVKCAVCKSIFCCVECRNKHEQNAHTPNEVWTERNRMRCGLCQGNPTMEFQCRNDFALIMHLCQAHLPLHCKKCLTQFNSIGDFSSANKCAHINDGCSLHSPKESVQKSSFERSISDSVSLRNYSTILHTSNHPLYKTQSPDAMEKALVRQTSTPMHQNLLHANSHDTVGQSCSSCLVSSSSSSSGHISNVNSSSDSDTSTNPLTNSDDNKRQNVQQQSIMVTQKKTTTFKRSRNSLAVTPLTRQVMTKSIHRAILEYQNSQHGIAVSPKSPLDLRMRGREILKMENTSSKTVKCEKRSPKVIDKSSISTSIVVKSNSLDSNLRQSSLETVYEQDKDANVETFGCYERECCVSSNYEVVEVLSDQSIINEPLLTSESIKETPVLVSRKLSSEKIVKEVKNIDPEIWFTPKEFAQTKLVENIDIYTPKVSKKRATVRRFDDDNEEEYAPDLENEFETHKKELPNGSRSEPIKSSGSKIWSFVSTFLRFASLTPPSDMSMPDIKTNDSDASHVIIKRCASFTGVLREQNISNLCDDGSEVDPLQPIKRRRITSTDSPLGEPSMNYSKRIMCRPPIRRMLNK